MKDIVDRLEDMANGWLCAGLHDADLPAEGALEIARLRSLANDTHEELSELREDCAALRKDAELLAWILTHPETAAEELEDATASEGTARSNIEKRREGIAAARFGAA